MCASPPRSARYPRWLLFGLAALLLFAQLGVAQTITELAATPRSFPFGITQGPDGRIWFTDLRNRSVGALSLTRPAQEYRVDVTTPAGLCAGPDGSLWFTGAPNESGIASVGRMKPDGTFTLFPLPAGLRSPEQIAAGPDGNLWFAEGLNHIGRVTTAGTFTMFSTPDPSAQPLDITVGPDGALWFTEVVANQIGRITVDGVISEFPVPAPSTGPLWITNGPDGALWFTQPGDNLIRRLSTDGAFSTFVVPTPNSKPGRIVAGPDGNLWFGEDIGKIGRLTPTGIFTEFPLPTFNPGVGRLTVGADGAIWFVEPNVSQIGRITTGSCEASATALCLNNRRFEVSVDWEVAANGTSGHGAAVPLTVDTGYFWFFTANNVELTIKVVDGRAFNNKFWVFYGALSDVAYTVTVRDTVSGQTKTYRNPQGTLASFADTNAF